MSEDRSRILSLLAAGKITADEAERLLDGDPSPLVAALPKYLYVQVNGSTGDNVHLKIPLALVRSGLKLTSLIPAQAMDQINKSMSEHGMSIDFTNLKPEDIDELIESLREMEINVDGKNGDVVRVYCA